MDAGFVHIDAAWDNLRIAVWEAAHELAYYPDVRSATPARLAAVESMQRAGHLTPDDVAIDRRLSTLHRDSIGGRHFAGTEDAVDSCMRKAQLLETKRWPLVSFQHLPESMWTAIVGLDGMECLVRRVRIGGALPG